MPIRYQADQNDVLTYENTLTGRRVHVWKEDLADITEVCAMCAPGPRSSVAKIVKGDYSYPTIQRALEELRHIRDGLAESNIDEDDYIDLLTAIDDLEGIARRLAQLQ